jgi:hypothetical protein
VTSASIEPWMHASRAALDTFVDCALDEMGLEYQRANPSSGAAGSLWAQRR